MNDIPAECRSEGCTGSPQFDGFCIECATSRPSWRVVEVRNDPHAPPADLDPAIAQRFHPVPIDDDLPVCDVWPACQEDPDEDCNDCRAHARQKADNTGQPLLGLT